LVGIETNPKRSEKSVMRIPIVPMTPSRKRKGRNWKPGGKGDAEEPEEVVICIEKRN
jgi:hypothetical protein